jgi:hypothetical protein
MARDCALELVLSVLGEFVSQVESLADHGQRGGWDSAKSVEAGSVGPATGSEVVLVVAAGAAARLAH